MLIIVLPEQHYNKPNHIGNYALTLANAHGGHAVWPRVGSVTPPHPYRPLRLLAGPLPHRQETFCFFIKSWGQIDIFP